MAGPGKSPTGKVRFDLGSAALKEDALPLGRFDLGSAALKEDALPLGNQGSIWGLPLSRRTLYHWEGFDLGSAAVKEDALPMERFDLGSSAVKEDALPLGHRGG